nr:hypothetical protein [Candidatus Woesearchaeota archaeon]
MNFKRLRFTNKENGTQVRVLKVNVTNLTEGIKPEDAGRVIFSDTQGSIYMALESKAFNAEYVEGWLTKEDLGLESDEKVEDDDIRSTLTKEVLDEIAEEDKKVSEDNIETDFKDEEVEKEEVKPKPKKK